MPQAGLFVFDISCESGYILNFSALSMSYNIQLMTLSNQLLSLVFTGILSEVVRQGIVHTEHVLYFKICEANTHSETGNWSYCHRTLKDYLDNNCLQQALHQALNWTYNRLMSRVNLPVLDSLNEMC